MDVIGDLTNNPSPVEIKLFGDDTPLLHATAEKVKSLIETVPGVVDVANGIVISGPSLIVNVDDVKASVAGLNPADVRDQLETMIRGHSRRRSRKARSLSVPRALF